MIRRRWRGWYRAGVRGWCKQPRMDQASHQLPFYPAEHQGPRVNANHEFNNWVACRSCQRHRQRIQASTSFFDTGNTEEARCKSGCVC